MGKKNKNKKIFASPEEKLWKRITTHFGNNEELWNDKWNSKTIMDFLISSENLKLNDKENKQLKSKVDEILAHSKKRNEWFILSENSFFQLRNIVDIRKIEQNINEWRHQFNREFNIENELDDSQLLIEKIWICLINNDELPKNCSLSEKESILKWKDFDLIREIKKYAIISSKLRFNDPFPCIAFLLVKKGLIDAATLLDLRLKHLRLNNDNPFGRNYDPRLSEIAERIPDVDVDTALREGRKDLRELPFVTIDPKTAKDFDDAVCLVEEEDKKTLWIAIADVSNYILPDTALDDEAKTRATSVYLPHTVLPMLPSKLSDNLCSLKEKVPRLAMALSIEIENDWTVGNVEAFESLILVKENLSYEDVVGNPRFENMITLAKELRKKQTRLNLNSSELRPRVNDDSVEIKVKWPNEATQMIETFMVEANNSIGILLGDKNAPLPWRNHAPPDNPEVEELNAKFVEMDIDIQLPQSSTKKIGQSDEAELADLLGNWAQSGNIEISGLEVEDEENIADYLKNVLDPEARKNILEALRSAQEKATSLKESTRRIVDHGLFYLLQRAFYSSDNIGHFGLNLDAYVHFTSPIRRYADLIVHRQLKSFLRGEEWIHSEKEVKDYAEICTSNSRIAKSIEWELTANIFHLHLLRGGTLDSNENIELNEKVWPARVVGLRMPWIFLDLLDDGSIQGRLHVNQLGDGRQLNVDDYGLKLVDESSENSEHDSVILELGQRFPCRIRGLDLWSGRLDLSPI